MKEFKAYHKGTDVVKFKRVEFSGGYSTERTYDENGNELTYKNSYGYSYEFTYDENGRMLTYKSSNDCYRVKGKDVTKEEFDNFINRPCLGKKVIVDGVEYELK